MNVPHGFDTPENEERFIMSVVRCLDGESSTDEIQKLQEQLRASELHRGVFVEICQQNSRLQELFTFDKPDHTPGDFRQKGEGGSSLYPPLDDAFSTNDSTPIDPGISLENLERSCQSDREAAAQPPAKPDAAKLPFYITAIQFFGSPIPLTCILLCALVIPLAHFLWPHTPPVSQVVTMQAAPPMTGKVDRAIGCEWDTDKGATLGKGGLVVTDQTYSLESGLLSLNFSSGVKAILEGPSTFSTSSDMRIFLHRGKVAVRVPHGVKDFVVAADGFDVIDRGTAFGVEIPNDTKAEVQVFEGRVDLVVYKDTSIESVRDGDRELSPDEISNNNASTSLALVAGQAVSLNRLSGETKRTQPKEQQFVTEIPSGTGLISRLANASFESPTVADHPKTSQEYGDLRGVTIPGWNSSSWLERLSTAFLQQAPFPGPGGIKPGVIPYGPSATEGKQVLGMRLYPISEAYGGGIVSAWAFQTIGIPTTADVGKTLQLQADVARNRLPEESLPYKNDIAATLAFTTSTSPQELGQVIGQHGTTRSFSSDGANATLKASVVIQPQMVGQKLYVRLSLKADEPSQQGCFIHFDNVKLEIH